MTAPRKPATSIARRLTYFLAARLTPAPVTGTDRAVVLLAGLFGVIGVGVADYTSGKNLDLAVFYLLPVVAATVTGGEAAGYVVAAAAGVSFALEDSAINHYSGGIAITNGVFRFATYAVVILLVQVLRELANAARASDERSREFLATAAHQLRTPVAGILASAEALATETSESRRRRLAQNLAGEARRIGRLVSALLQASRLDQGQRPQRQPVNIGDLCEDEVDITRARAPHLSITFSNKAAVGVMSASLDATREALANLLDNAARHANTSVTVILEAAVDRVMITVADDGPGLPADAEETVFERFVSLDGRGGAGLGLSIARALTRAQGGNVSWVGDRFVLWLPHVGIPRSTPQENR
jgi:signal transduction histidine kinase